MKNVCVSRISLSISITAIVNTRKIFNCAHGNVVIACLAKCYVAKSRYV